MLKLTPSIFYDLTPCEYQVIVDQFTKHEGDFYNNLGAVVYQAFGSAQAGKKYKPLFNIKENEKVKQGSAEDRKEALEYFKQRGYVRQERR